MCVCVCVCVRACVCVLYHQALKKKFNLCIYLFIFPRCQVTVAGNLFCVASIEGLDYSFHYSGPHRDFLYVVHASIAVLCTLPYTAWVLLNIFFACVDCVLW